MKIQKINTGIIITKTAKQPSTKIEFSLDELDALSEFCERLQDEKDIREYLNTAVTIPDSAEVSAPIAAKYLRDAALFEQLVDETRRNQEENQSDFLTAVSDAVSSIEKSRDVKEWHGLTKDIAERFAREFMAERNPGRWSGFGEVPESVSLDPLNFPINDIYPKGNKPALRMQLISVTYPSLHRVCECSIIEDGVDLWARRTLDSMTAGTVEDLVETVLYVARMHAIALANTCDLRCRDTREEQYNAIVQKYDEKTVQQFAVLTAITMTALLENPEQDFLGTVYHNLGLSKSQAGQFFTPYNVGQMMARMSMPDSFVLDKSRIWRVNDPCCGAGCLLLAGYNAMREQLESTDPDWDKYVLFVAQDIDPLACKMCYIQMCCIGVPGVVVAGNSLFPDAERAPTDFWFTHKYFALDEKALENTYQKTKE